MGLFDDCMNLLDLGERVVKGEGQAVKEEILRDMRDAKAAPKDATAPAGKACDKAPHGYRCNGKHDAKGRCVDLTVLATEDNGESE